VPDAKSKYTLWDRRDQRNQDPSRLWRSRCGTSQRLLCYEKLLFLSFSCSFRQSLRDVDCAQRTSRVQVSYESMYYGIFRPATDLGRFKDLQSPDPMCLVLGSVPSLKRRSVRAGLLIGLQSYWRLSSLTFAREPDHPRDPTQNQSRRA
jgi:hypothetical protein